MKKILTILLLMISCQLTAQGIGPWRDKTAAQLSEITDYLTVYTADYFNTHAYLQIEDLVTRADKIVYVSDFADIATAVAAVPDSGILYFSRGTYDISGGDTVYFKNKDHITIMGEWGNRITNSSSTLYTPVTFDSCDNVRIHGLYIDGGGSKYFHNGIEVNTCLYSVITDCYVYRCNNNGISSVNIAPDGTGSKQCRLINTTVRDCGNDGIVLSISDNWQIIGCNVYGAGRHGLTAYLSRQVYITNCSFATAAATGGYGMYIYDTAGGSDSWGVHIDNCSVRATGSHNIVVVKTDNCIISNCSLGLAGWKNSGTFYSVLVDGDSDFNMISNNQFYEGYAAGEWDTTTTAFVRLNSSDVDTTFVLNNFFETSLDASISDNADGTISSGNWYKHDTISDLDGFITSANLSRGRNQDFNIALDDSLGTRKFNILNRSGNTKFEVGSSGIFRTYNHVYLIGDNTNTTPVYIDTVGDDSYIDYNHTSKKFALVTDGAQIFNTDSTGDYGTIEFDASASFDVITVFDSTIQFANSFAGGGTILSGENGDTVLVDGVDNNYSAIVTFADTNPDTTHYYIMGDDTLFVYFSGTKVAGTARNFAYLIFRR